MKYMTEPESGNHIELHHLLSKDRNGMLAQVLRPGMKKVFSIDRLNAVFNQAVREKDSRSLFHSFLKIFDVQPDVSLPDLNKIPERGPAVVVANHPFNGLDVIALAAIVAEVRKDIRILGNYIISNIPILQDWNIPVCPKKTGGKVLQNAGALRKAVKWVKEGGLLIVFPAGEKLRIYHQRNQIYDGRWSPHMAAIIRLARATTVPVYLPGKMSHPLHLFGAVYPRLRSFLLTREILKPVTRVEAFVGKSISWAKLSGFHDDREIINYIRTKTYFLRNRDSFEKPKSRASRNIVLQPVIAAVEPSLLMKEITALPDNQKLCSDKGFAVYVFSAVQGPNLLREIGRLREETFRAVKEGTGKPVDLDKYDDYYRHLILWNESTRELIGAYRIALSDEILERYGTKGFYTHSLFRLKPAALRQLGTFIELGRSFIRREYQKQYSMLLLLWKGIAQFIVRHPQYRYLFGPVSISNDYNRISKNMLYLFLKDRYGQQGLSSRIKPRKPFPAKRVRAGQKKYLFDQLKDIDDVSVLISEIEKDGKGVPVLLKHYLKLNAKLLSFNVDKEFSSVLDGLILVDLMETNERYLRRFMGVEGYRKFRDFHNPQAGDS